jgi:hypothetical protein
VPPGAAQSAEPPELAAPVPLLLHANQRRADPALVGVAVALVAVTGGAACVTGLRRLRAA